MHSEHHYVLRTPKPPACPHARTSACSPSATGLRSAPHSETRDKRMVSGSFSAVTRAPKPVAPHFPHFTIFDWVWLRVGVGVWAAAAAERERESAADSWRTAVQLWLSKREKLRETGTKARQLHPLGCLGLPTTSPCFSKPYVHPLPQTPTHPPS